jgi:hypothetical protein
VHAVDPKEIETRNRNIQTFNREARGPTELAGKLQEIHVVREGSFKYNKLLAVKP